MNLKPRPREEPEINLVSLIDVVLLLVIFFMVSTTFVQDGRIRIQLPEATAPAERVPADAIVITITAQGGYRVNERPLVNNSPETLSAALLQLAGTERKQTITLRADARATHQSVVTAMDTVGKLGFGQINIVTLNAAAANK